MIAPVISKQFSVHVIKLAGKDSVPKGQRENSPEILFLGNKINTLAPVPLGTIDKNRLKYYDHRFLIRPLSQTARHAVRDWGGNDG
ncbi:hypothetical protein L0244_28250 [bacterium]|nr:hypothetical protein [bacterium]